MHFDTIVIGGGNLFRGLAAPRVGRLLFLDRPSGIPGHGGGALPAFTSRYGECLLGFIERDADCG